MYKLVRLPNGAVFGLYAMDSVKSVSMKAMLTAGPVVEDKQNNGASHFIEHIVLDGTATYPTKLSFATELEELGVSYGGYTTIQEMGFEFDIPYTNLYKTIDILEEILFHPIFSQEIIDKERSVILEEMQDRENSPDFQFFMECLYARFSDPDHMLRRKVIGTKEIIASLSKDALHTLYERIFVPSNLYVGIAGNFDMDTLVAYIEKKFGDLPVSAEFTRPFFSSADLSGVVHVAKSDEKFSNVYANLSFKGFGREMDSKTELSLRIFAAMFAGLRTSRLFQDVREKEGLVYDISSDWYTAWGVGSFAINFESDSTKVDRIMEIVYKDIEGILHNGFSDEELLHTKNYFANRTLLGFSTPGKIMQWMLDYLFDKQEVLFPEDIIAIGNTIEHGDIHALIQEIFDFSTLNIVMMGKLGSYNLEKTIASLKKQYPLL